MMQDTGRRLRVLRLKSSQKPSLHDGGPRPGCLGRSFAQARTTKRRSAELNTREGTGSGQGGRNTVEKAHSHSPRSRKPFLESSLFHLGRNILLVWTRESEAPQKLRNARCTDASCESARHGEAPNAFPAPSDLVANLPNSLARYERARNIISQASSYEEESVTVSLI